MLALEGDLAGKSAPMIAADLFGADWMEDVAWHDAAERGTARRRIEKARQLRDGGYLDLASGRAKPWRTARLSGGKSRKAAKARAAAPPLDPDWLRTPRGGRRPAAPEGGRRYLGAKEAAEYVGLSTSTMSRMRRDESGPPYAKKGRRVIYDVHQLDAWMAQK